MGNYSSFWRRNGYRKGFEVSGLAVWIGSQISFIEQTQLIFNDFGFSCFCKFLDRNHL